MIIKLVKFGEMLTSRPSGRDAYLSAKAYLLKGKPKMIQIDFSGVKVLTPSWMDEFLTQLKKDYSEVTIDLLKSDNPTVKTSLDIISHKS